MAADYKYKEILISFMEQIQEFESEVEGSPTKEDFATLDAIYVETIEALRALTPLTESLEG